MISPTQAPKQQATPRFVAVSVRTAFIVHGYDEDSDEVMTPAPPTPFALKLVALERVLSISDRYILVTGSHGRVMYWEYEGGFESLQHRLHEAGALL